jgi:hypothetical protein
LIPLRFFSKDNRYPCIVDALRSLRVRSIIVRQQRNLPDEVPDIRPVVLCDPPIPPPPDSLKHINFNDHVCYLITAAKAMEQRRLQ